LLEILVSFVSKRGAFLKAEDFSFKKKGGKGLACCFFCPSGARASLFSLHSLREADERKRIASSACRMPLSLFFSSLPDFNSP